MRWEKTVIRAPADRVQPTRVNSSAHAVRFGPLLFVTGQSGRRQDGVEYDLLPSDQARQCLENIRAILETAGASFHDVLKRTIYVTNRDDYDQVRPIVDEYFVDPVASTIVVTGLLRDDRKSLEIEVIAGISASGGENEQ